MAWAADLWAGENHRRGQPSTGHPQPRAATVDHYRWADALEKRARRCRGCGEWNFGELCDWCADVCEPQETYGFRWTGNVNRWAVLREGRVVHRAPTLLEAENWVTRGGADTYELSNKCSTMVPSDTPADAGGPGAAQTTPDLADDPKEVIDNG